MKTFPTSDDYLQKAVIQSLLELKKRDPQGFFELISPPLNLMVSDKMVWLGNEKSLHVFFDLVINNKMVSVKWELFKNLFIGNDPIEQVVWEAGTNELLYLIDSFRDEDLIAQSKTPHKQLQNSFLDKFKKRLKPTSMATMLDRGINREKRIEILEKIIKAVKVANSSS